MSETLAESGIPHAQNPQTQNPQAQNLQAQTSAGFVPRSEAQATDFWAAINGGVGAAVAMLRRQQLMGQGALAGAVRVSQATASKWERGLLRLHVDRFVELAELLHVDPGSLLNRACQRQGQLLALLPLHVDLAALLGSDDPVDAKLHRWARAQVRVTDNAGGVLWVTPERVRELAAFTDLDLDTVTARLAAFVPQLAPPAGGAPGPTAVDLPVLTPVPDTNTNSDSDSDGGGGGGGGDGDGDGVVPVYTRCGLTLVEQAAVTILAHGFHPGDTDGFQIVAHATGITDTVFLAALDDTAEKLGTDSHTATLSALLRADRIRVYDPTPRAVPVIDRETWRLVGPLISGLPDRAIENMLGWQRGQTPTRLAALAAASGARNRCHLMALSRQRGWHAPTARITAAPGTGTHPAQHADFYAGFCADIADRYRLRYMRELAAKGMSNKGIAAAAGLDDIGVREWLHRLAVLVGVQNKVQLAGALNAIEGARGGQ